MSSEATRHALLAWALSRGAYALLLALMGVFSADHALLAHPEQALSVLRHYDARQEIAIAQSGYTQPWQSVYFPLYPALIRGLATLVALVDPAAAARVFSPLGLVACGVVVSNVAALGALIGLARLAVREGASARLTLLLLLAYPLASFLLAPWSESLFLLCAVWALYSARTSRWGRATMWSVLAAITHPLAVILWAPILWEFARERARSPRHVLAHGIALASAIPMTLVAYALLWWRRTGDLFLLGDAERRTFSHHLLWPWQTVALLVTDAGRAVADGGWTPWRLALDVAPLLVAITVLVWAWPHLSGFWRLYQTSLVLLSVATPVVGAQFPDPFVSAGRYLCASFPLLLWLATARPADEATRRAEQDRVRFWRRALAGTLITGALACQALVAIGMLHGAWIV